ncbi:hypothetical protein TIFTF001_032945 [Ficus carica]|uniref:Pectinesterase inhibitor domain-containing protein n=1 Tax=Ficus carica TaxID=3494 RepID=A0AA88DXB8_FICCA|nr:hypothetical protein TIFTF001_032945 [Ficus carica]
MPSSTTLLFFLLFLLSFPHHHRHLLAAVAADTALIQQTCKTTKHYDLCVSSLISDPTSLQASDAKGLAVIMITIGVANSTATSAYLSSQLPRSTSTTAASDAAAAAAKKAVLKECAAKYGYAAEALQASAQDLVAESFDYASMHVTAAADYPNSCHNAFRGVVDITK